ncbi:Exopolysaccharide biosynthesis protein [Clostridium acidisoli DSM 12555]|uniref:Exopolysaccharide biosynthesis protein n=1 Tax=Clostridium acidisoli DSM 12555 TaxID=1121291 RepID=A0A1W1XMI7_9CLOT|nr:phosphodiester glycosidase family protein [Clostridium acidisoli]SMC24748.1 Exopolysaccharide biosynthesis protein [Clostridium acidisoli DSM 12555]
MKNKVNNRQYNTKKTKSKNKVKKIKTWKLILYFVLFQFLFGIATAPIIVYYSPLFTNLRKNIVGTAMSTNSHAFIATLFLSDKQIQQILNGDGSSSVSAMAQDLSRINLSGGDNRIEKATIQGKKFNGIMVIVHNPKRVKIGYSSKLGTVGQKTSEIAKENNAVAAINGGGFNDKGNNSTTLWTGTGAIPTGIVISRGKLIFPQREDLDTKQVFSGVAGITNKGKLVVGDHTVDELLQLGVTDALCFGPTLIENGTEIKGLQYQGANPRTAIGQKSDGSIILLTIDGRQGLEAGATIEDVQQTMKEEGVLNAVNLDGGASTTMYYDGKVINSPSDKFGERPVPTAIYVTK